MVSDLITHKTDLPTLVNAAHADVVKAANEALTHAMRCGDLLAEAKKACGHGTWQNWLAENFEGSYQTANLYVKLASGREAIENMQNSNDVGVLGLNDARKLIAKKRKPVGETESEPVTEVPEETASEESQEHDGPEQPRFVGKAVGLKWAMQAMNNLKRIPPNDPEREEAWRKISDFLDHNRVTVLRQSDQEPEKTLPDHNAPTEENSSRWRCHKDRALQSIANVRRELKYLGLEKLHPSLKTLEKEIKNA